MLDTKALVLSCFTVHSLSFLVNVVLVRSVFAHAMLDHHAKDTNRGSDTMCRRCRCGRAPFKGCRSVGSAMQAAAVCTLAINGREDGVWCDSSCIFMSSLADRMTSRSIDRLSVVLHVVLAACALASPTRFSIDMNEVTSLAPDVSFASERYMRVMKKMDVYCEQPYNETDDRTIDLYTQCFANLLRAVSMAMMLPDPSHEPVAHDTCQRNRRQLCLHCVLTVGYNGKKDPNIFT